MAFKKRNHHLPSQENTGFGTNSNSSAGRFYNRTGGANVSKKGVGVLERYSWYHTMLGMKRTKFLLSLLAIYILLNLGFAGLYYLIGIRHLAGVNVGSPLKNFTEVFFFSTQTFTTVGYGRISPTGFLTSALATFEAFLGLLSFAIATGLFYGRFSRPQAFLRFSENAIIAPYKDGTALMMRVAPYKNNILSEAEIQLTMAMQLEEDGKLSNKFYSLKVEIPRINSLALSWTIVHRINEDSPFYGMSDHDIQQTNIEVFAFIKAFDEVFSNQVVMRSSYVSSEIIWGAKFNMMYHPNPGRKTTVLDLSKLNSFEKASLPLVES